MSDFYNAAADLLDRNLTKHAGKIAFIDDCGSITFGALRERVGRFAGYLDSIALPPETRIMLCLVDGIDFVTACLGAIKAGLVPVMVNPLLPPADLDYLLRDSRARLLLTCDATWPSFEGIVAKQPYLEHILMAGQGPAPAGAHKLDEAVSAAPCREAATLTRLDEPCLWQYSSGSTGRPKGTIHTHANVRNLLSLYPQEILALDNDDVTFSAAKLFFGYGFGNGLLFPLSVGATAILMAERPTAAAVWKRLVEHRVTVFYGVPTLYNSMLSAGNQPARESLALRICTSAGEALPAEIGRRWKTETSVDILDGIGSTEMLHIFLSNRIGDIAPGTTGKPLSGYTLRLIDNNGQEVAEGEVGELHIKGPTSAIGYWCKREQSQATFVGKWTRSGDTFFRDTDGRYHYCGRSDDMLKVSGIYVAPFEVESALCEHPAVLEAAVVAWSDEADLIKPKAFVVLRDPANACEELARELQRHVKAVLAPYKYPRWIDFVDALPKTATGKVERYKLRRPITSS